MFNLTKENSRCLMDYYKDENWHKFLKEKESEARKYIENIFNKILDQKIKNSLKEIDEEIRKLQTQSEREEFSEQIELLNQLRKIILAINFFSSSNCGFIKAISCAFSEHSFSGSRRFLVKLIKLASHTIKSIVLLIIFLSKYLAFVFSMFITFFSFFNFS